MLGNLFKNAIKDIKKEIIKTDNRHNQHNRHNGNDIDRRDTRYEYFAVVSKSGFYEGEIKDISMGRSLIKMCSTYDELLTKLTAKLNEEVERCKKFNQPLPAKTSREALAAKFPGKEIVSINATVRI